MPNSTTFESSSHLSPKLVPFVGHSAGIDCLAFSPDGVTLASGSSDRSIIFWNIASGEMERCIDGADRSLDWIGYRPDGTALASSGRDGARFWNPRDGTLVRTREQLFEAFSFTPDGHLFGSVERGKTLVIWDVDREKVLQRLELASGWDRAAALSHDCSAVSISDGTSVRILSFPTGQVLHEFTVAEEQLRNEHVGQVGVEEIVFSHDGNTLAAKCFCGIRFWNAANGEYVGFYTHDYKEPHSIAFSPDDSTIASGWSDGTVVVGGVGGIHRIKAHQTWATSVAFSPDGSILASGGTDNAVRLWDVKSGEEAQRLGGQRSEVNSVAFTPDSASLISGHADGILAVWSTATISLKRSVSGLLAPTRAVAVSPDGRAVASIGGWAWASGSKPVELRLSEVERPNAGTVLSTEPTQCDSVAFSMDSGLLAASGRTGIVNLWDISTGEIRHRFPGYPPIAFSPDGHTLALGSDGGQWSAPSSVNLWNLNTGEIEHTLVAYHPAGEGRKAVRERVTALAISADGGMVAIGYECYVAMLWNARTGELQRELTWRTYSDTVSALAFSPDGKTLAVGIAYDNAVHLWDTQSGEERKKLTGHRDHVEALAYSPDGRVLATASEDGTTKLWHTDDDTLIVTLLLLNPGDRTEPEWMAFTPDSHYSGSEGVERHIRWTTDSRVLPGNAYASVFRHPDLQEYFRH